MKNKSVMSHRFSEVPRANIPRSSFDRSHSVKTTFDAGYLVPIYVDEALPGDTFNLSLNAFARLGTPLHPIMDNLYISTFFFAVPIRLIWANWEKFNGAQDNPADSTDYLVPTMPATASTGYSNESLHDYLSLPTKIPDYSHSSLWHRGYNLIWNEWFRDQNLQDSVTVDTDDGPDDPADYVLLKRGKRHDYFTSALPWPQKGDSVDIPLGTSAPVDYITGVGNPGRMRYATTDGLAGADTNAGATDAVGEMHVLATDAYYDPNGTLEADLSTATAATINQLRQAFQIQKLYERDARGGTRYTEIVRSHFGVTSPDARLQRPEYLGGGRTPININPVAQTSESGTTPQGNLSAFGVSVINGNGFVKSFTEHCVLLGLACLHADLTYQQGLNRMFTRSTRFDFYWPALATIGEQTIPTIELYCQDPTTDTGATGTPDNEKVFGYQERYAEYRYKPSVVTGKFRSNDAASLDTWLLTQEFGSLPLLNDSFIQENPPVDRVIATPSEPHLLYDSYIQLRCARPMPIYGVPGMIDHF